MIDLHELALFIGAVLMLMISPGPNMAFVVAHGVSCGWRGGVAAAVGITAADLVLTALTAAGIGGLVASWPLALEVIRVIGVGYLLWMAWQAWNRPSGLLQLDARHKSLRAIARRAAVNSLFNPKALLFFVMFLPQFADAHRGPIAMQLMALGLVLSLVALLFHALLGTVGGALAGLLGSMPSIWPSRMLALILAGLAAKLAGAHLAR